MRKDGSTGNRIGSPRTWPNGRRRRKNSAASIGSMPNCRVTGEGVSFTGTSQKGVGVGLNNEAENGSHPARRAL